ncbi:MAG: SBBP repeat-containing protein [Bacteroidota bacterium]
MKTFLQYITYAVLFIGSTVNPLSIQAQSLDWHWAKTTGGVGEDRANDIAIDKSGNLYVIGSYALHAIYFEDILLFNYSNSQEIFIAKYDPQGTVLWAKSVGGQGTDAASGLAIDNNGNVYITGSFQSPTLEFGNTVLNSSGKYDIFIAKYDPEGNVLWAKSAGGSKDDKGLTIGTDENNNVYLTGSFGVGAITFGATTLTNNSTQNHTNDIFIVKYDTSGNAVWATSIGGDGYDEANNIAIDKNSNVYITGSFNSNPLTLNGIPLENNGISIIKYDSNGNRIRIESFDKKTYISDISISNKGDIFITGSFADSTVSFGSDTLHNSGGRDVFVVKHDSAGNVLWARSATGSSRDVSKNIITDSQGNAFVTGSFESPAISFDGVVVNNNPPQFSSYAEKSFIVKYDAEGDAISANYVGTLVNGNGSDYGSTEISDITVDPEGDSYITGYFVREPITFGADTLTAISTGSMFIAKLSTTITSIVEKSTITPLTIFPNPTASQFHIANLSPGNWTITIYTLDGQSVFKKEFTEANATIDLSGKAKGAYVYRLLKDGEVFKSGKIVVE